MVLSGSPISGWRLSGRPFQELDWIAYPQAFVPVVWRVAFPPATAGNVKVS